MSPPSPDEARLAQLVDELASKPSYATGGRLFPRPVSPDDAVAIARALADSVDEGTAARAAQAKRDGYAIACAPGCNACCEVPVMVYRPEALAIARSLAHPSRAAARAKFLAAYPRWRETVGDRPERLSELFRTGQQEAFDALLLETWRLRPLCAFDDAGRCLVYSARPIGCRNAHALGDATRCAPDSPRPPEAVTFVPLDELVAKSRRLLRATHNALHPAAPARHRLEALCAAVYELLTDGG